MTSSGLQFELTGNDARWRSASSGSPLPEWTATTYRRNGSTTCYLLLVPSVVKTAAKSTLEVQRAYCSVFSVVLCGINEEIK